MNLRAAALTLLLAILAVPAWAQDCPGAKSNDDCDRIVFEKADAELARAVESRLVAIGRRSTFSGPVEQAKSLFSTAQLEWLRFREAECKARTAATSLISARTVDGLTFACLGSLTSQRIEEIRRY